MYDLIIVSCAYRGMVTGAVKCLDRLRSETKIKFDFRPIDGDALIGRARSLAAYHFLKANDAPYMLFIDDDILYQPKDVAQILVHLRNGYDVIGGIYPVGRATQLSSYGWNGHIPIDGKVQDIEYLATGFMGISRRILEKVKDDLKLPLLHPNDWATCYPFFVSGAKLDRPKGDPIYISEDWDWCEKVRAVGGKVYADTSVQLAHVKEQVFTCADVKNHQISEDMEKRVYGGLKRAKEVSRALPDDVANFTHQSVPVVVGKINAGRETVNKDWLAYKGASVDFYKTNKDYIYDLSLFHMNEAYYNEHVGQLVNISGCEVLNMGCGIGTESFMMDAQGNKVVGYDINQYLIDFANYRKEKHGFKNTEFTTEMPDPSKFDLVTCVDVLEHIEDLQGFLSNLCGRMKRGAKLYHDDRWPNDDNPMHYDHRADIDKWLQDNNMVSWDTKWAIKA